MVPNMPLKRENANKAKKNNTTGIINSCFESVKSFIARSRLFALVLPFFRAIPAEAAESMKEAVKRQAQIRKNIPVTACLSKPPIALIKD